MTHRLFTVLLPLFGIACAPAASSSPAPAPAGTLLFVDHSAPPPLPDGIREIQSTAGPNVLFLNFDGATIIKGSASDAAANTSFLCGGTIPAFDHQPFPGERAQVIDDIVARVEALFADFDLRVVTTRPAAPPYDMVVVGGDAPLCGYPAGLGGVGPLDCKNQLPGEIAFIFSAPITSLQLLAVVIAHEAAHSWGLPHTLEGCDVMSNSLCNGGIDKTFLDQEMAVAPDHQAICGASTANSWRNLQGALGLRTSGPPDADRTVDGGQVASLDVAILPGDVLDPTASASGCSLGPLAPVNTLPGFLLVWVLFGLLRGRRREPE